MSIRLKRPNPDEWNMALSFSHNNWILVVSGSTFYIFKNSTLVQDWSPVDESHRGEPDISAGYPMFRPLSRSRWALPHSSDPSFKQEWRPSIGRWFPRRLSPEWIWIHETLLYYYRWPSSFWNGVPAPLLRLLIWEVAMSHRSLKQSHMMIGRYTHFWEGNRAWWTGFSSVEHLSSIDRKAFLWPNCLQELQDC